MAKTYEHAQSLYNKEVIAASKRQEARSVRKDALDYATMGMWCQEKNTLGGVLQRAAAFEKYLTNGTVPKAVKKADKK
jgi:hypothetical protein